MSKKNFCDNCSRELVRDVDNIANHPIEPAPGGVTVRIEAGYNQIGRGDVCAHCVVAEVIRHARVLDLLPKEPSPSIPQK